MAITDSLRPGLVRPLTGDGIDIEIDPRSISVRPELRVVEETTLSGETITTTHSVRGEPDKIYRNEFFLEIDLRADEDPDVIDAIRDLDMVAGHVSFCLWQPERTQYTAAAGQVQFVLPHQRRNAGAVLAGLTYDGKTTSTTTVPVKAWLNGTALTVNYADGPTVDRPDAGEITIARDPILSGEQRNFVEMRVGDDLVSGDILKLEFTPVYFVAWKRTDGAFLAGQAERQSYRLTEI
jgi:hypothetical protein